MTISKKILKEMNKLFPLPVHPFNLQNEGKKTYAEWQFEKGYETIKFYLPYTSLEEMFKDKTVLDVGCGAAGKSLYYASQGAEKVYGIDPVKSYKEEAEKLAEKKGLKDKFEFIIGDAANLPFEDDFFDTIILNDAMEHVDMPEKVLDECYRTLKKGGRVYINFPPYNHPYGAHLSDAIGIPWVHLFFSDKTLIEVYKDLVKDLPDGQSRINFRISRDKQGREYFSYINKMTIKRFNKIISKAKFVKRYYSEAPLRSIVSYLSKLPLLKEYFVKMVVFIGEK
ncbi:Methyltransferase domain-containing protein [Caminicella sporogenes DSM 14501]|uniref:Methyltransferase domain-containing protein n=1 Tax=Caminicella sporogenes DSM 14501 TaxID=1121266 RepID=A0A1M6PQX0_9FIRM|nr:class I SAM-dependent methyltransferase [Caminicella sporogenes]RKD22012.1 methyltransferase [Caminicella sporogenes]SHK10327.1 Methyltransferase domain-containing protein [Caminicella sporogenes DSM 14501]